MATAHTRSKFTDLLGLVCNRFPQRADRKSMHVYAPPFAQLVESPTAFAGSPMQIDSASTVTPAASSTPTFVVVDPESFAAWRVQLGIGIR